VPKRSAGRQDIGPVTQACGVVSKARREVGRQFASEDRRRSTDATNHLAATPTTQSGRSVSPLVGTGRRVLRVLLGRVAAYGALTVVLVACGGSDDREGDTAGTSSTTHAGEVFEDPQGSYEIEVDPDWDAQHGTFAAEIEAWIVGESREGFAPNVNVLTQLAPGLDMSAYLDRSIEQGPSALPDFELLNSEVVDGTESELGLLEYTGTQNGRPLHFLATVAVRDGTAVVATFTAPPGIFDETRGEVEPYLLTLRAAQLTAET
jgi:hypothetical protein